MIPFILLCVPLFAFTLCSASTAHHSEPLTISSPNACRYDIDCSPGGYCGTRASISPETTSVGLCLPRLPLGALCPGESEADACQAGLYCARIDFDDVLGPIEKCQKQGKVGDACGFSNSACVADLVCDGETSKCRRPRRGNAGTACEFQSDCSRDAGFYCAQEEVNFITRQVCRPFKPFGSRCESSTGDASCRGYCRTERTGPFSSTPFCRPLLPIGTTCSANEQCAFSFEASDRRNQRADRVICNRATELEYGRCQRYSQLKKRLGDPCVRGKHDLCDGARGLRCLWAQHLRRTVCQQRHDVVAMQTPQFCDPRRPRLSRCTLPDTECRYQLNGRGRFRVIERFPKCLARRVYVPPGGRCDFEPARCTQGSRCTVVPGVTRLPPGGRGSIDDSPAFYCVLIRKRAGQPCWNKFRAQCGKGLKCLNGMCKKENFNRTASNKRNEPKEPSTANIGLDGECAVDGSGLPCAPGTICKESNTTTVGISNRPVTTGLCVVPSKTVRLWQPCGQHRALVDLRCESGNVCRLDANGRGRMLCRPLASAGMYCKYSEECKPGLGCPTDIAPGRWLADRRCSDVSSPKTLGSPCSPPGERDGRPCESRFSEEFPRRCLRKVGGDGVRDKEFVCQLDVSLFGSCDEKQHRTCGDSQLKCSSIGLCVPA